MSKRRVCARGGVRVALVTMLRDAIGRMSCNPAIGGLAKGNLVKEIDALQLGQCIDTKATDAEVEAEIAEARSLDVNGTPTMFINGRRIPNAIDWPNLKVIVDSEIEYQKTAKNAGDDCGCEVKLPVPGLPAPGPPAMSPFKKK